jgi:hypothetical protein
MTDLSIPRTTKCICLKLPCSSDCRKRATIAHSRLTAFSRVSNYALIDTSHATWRRRTWCTQRANSKLNSYIGHIPWRRSSPSLPKFKCRKHLPPRDPLVNDYHYSVQQNSLVGRSCSSKVARRIYLRDGRPVLLESIRLNNRSPLLWRRVFHYLACHFGSTRLKERKKILGLVMSQL